MTPAEPVLAAEDASRDTARRDVPTFRTPFAITRVVPRGSRSCCRTTPGRGGDDETADVSGVGREPWSVCYPEPSVRPDDSRYGRTRIGCRSTQFQVILKPAPENVREMYLGRSRRWASTGAHGVRFVEDN